MGGRLRIEEEIEKMRRVGASEASHNAILSISCIFHNLPWIYDRGMPRFARPCALDIKSLQYSGK